MKIQENVRSPSRKFNFKYDTKIKKKIKKLKKEKKNYKEESFKMKEGYK